MVLQRLVLLLLYLLLFLLLPALGLQLLRLQLRHSLLSRMPTNAMHVPYCCCCTGHCIGVPLGAPPTPALY
jgi:hypothetical protein